jgi:hypothetical protein
MTSHRPDYDVTTRQVREHLGTFLDATNTDVVVVVVGDGRTPRTAALFAMRTKWQIISIDPALEGLCTGSSALEGLCTGSSDNAVSVQTPGSAAGVSGGVATTINALPKELRHPNIRKQEQEAKVLAKRTQMKADIASLARLTLLSAKIQETAVCLTGMGVGGAGGGGVEVLRPHQGMAVAVRLPLSAAGHVVIVLPHAHVTPDEALGCLRFASPELPSTGQPPVGEAATAAPTPTISVVQLPCCGYVWHETVMNQPPDMCKLDARIATAARTVRVWKNVAPQFDFRGSARGRGVLHHAMDLTKSNDRKRQDLPKSRRKGKPKEQGKVEASVTALN